MPCLCLFVFFFDAVAAVVVRRSVAFRFAAVVASVAATAVCRPSPLVAAGRRRSVFRCRRAVVPAVASPRLVVGLPSRVAPLSRALAVVWFAWLGRWWLRRRRRPSPLGSLGGLICFAPNSSDHFTVTFFSQDEITVRHGLFYSTRHAAHCTGCLYSPPKHMPVLRLFLGRDADAVCRFGDYISFWREH